MSRLISRILLTVFMLPLAGIVYTAVFVVSTRVMSAGYYYPSRDVKAFLGSGVVAWVFVAGYWVALWGRGVRWDVRRVNATWGSVVVCAGVAAVIAVLLHQATNLASFAAFIGSSLAPMLWLVATVFVWRESKEERAARVRDTSEDALVCPVCGYNLTGLSEARCPECGAKFTLSELIARQPARETAAAESEITA